MKLENIKLLENTKFLVGELSNVQNLYFDTLLDELDVVEGEEEWLFDYIFNNSAEKTLEDYLKNFGKTLNDVIRE